MKTIRRRFSMIFRYYKTIIVTLVILVLCLIPAEEFSRFSVNISFGDVVVHFIMYFVFSAALYMDIKKATAKMNSKIHAFVWVVLIAASFGLLTELLQLLIKPLHRTGSVIDFSFDLAGAIVGALLIKITTQKSVPDSKYP